MSGVTGTHSNANAAYKYGSPSEAILNSGGVKHRVRLPSASPSTWCVCVCVFCRDVCWSPGHWGRDGNPFLTTLFEGIHPILRYGHMPEVNDPSVEIPNKNLLQSIRTGLDLRGGGGGATAQV